MHLTKILYVLFLYICYINCTFSVNGRKLQLNGKDFFMQGVCYYPIPIGYSSAVKYEQFRDTPSDRQVWERDLDIISKMGGNTIRMYGFENNVDHTAFFDAALAKGIQVLVQYWWDTGKSLSDPSIMAGWINMITKQQHPAVGMWIIHNELNYRYSGAELDTLFNLMDSMVDEVARIEGANHRPVTTPLANVNNVFDIIQKYNNRKLSLWATQVYNGRSFNNFLQQYAAISSKPLIVSEFGIDAYDAKRGVLDEIIQRDYDLSLMQELYTYSNITSGGTVFSYTDGLWKCGNDYNYDTCGGYNQAFPDETMNEEYFGIFYPIKNGDAPDILVARPVVAALTTLWLSHLATTQVQSSTTSQIPITTSSQITTNQQTSSQSGSSTTTQNSQSSNPQVTTSQTGTKTQTSSSQVPTGTTQTSQVPTQTTSSQYPTGTSQTSYDSNFQDTSSQSPATNVDLYFLQIGEIQLEAWHFGLILGGIVVAIAIIVLVLVVLLIPSVRNKIFKKEEAKRSSIQLPQIVNNIEQSNLNYLEKKIVEHLKN